MSHYLEKIEKTRPNGCSIAASEARRAERNDEQHNRNCEEKNADDALFTDIQQYSAT